MISLNTHLTWAPPIPLLGEPDHEADFSSVSHTSLVVPKARNIWDFIPDSGNQPRCRDSVDVLSNSNYIKHLHSENFLCKNFIIFIVVAIGKVISIPFSLVS